MYQKFNLFLLFTALTLCIMSCDGEPTKVTAVEKSFGETEDGASVTSFELKNENGITVELMTYGARITKIIVPDRDGNFGDIVLGHDKVQDYEEQINYFGCIAGRYANRIANGTFTLDGTAYQLAKNNNGHALHGGIEGFNQKNWEGQVFEKPEQAGVTFSYTSEDGEEGYPGTLDCRVTYTLNANNELQIAYEAVTDQATVVNLTNHAYFNLRDGGASPILDHELMIVADAFTPVDTSLIPTGEIKSVMNTPFDFRQAKKIGRDINIENEQLKNGLGYDHNFVLNNPDGRLSLAASVTEPTTGRTLDILTTEPGIQFYSGNFLNEDIIGKQGVAYQYRSGFCLETQHYPDSPNQPNFPSVVLRPGDQYKTMTVFRFGLQ